MSDQSTRRRGHEPWSGVDDDGRLTQLREDFDAAMMRLNDYEDRLDEISLALDDLRVQDREEYALDVEAVLVDLAKGPMPLAESFTELNSEQLMNIEIEKNMAELLSRQAEIESRLKEGLKTGAQIERDYAAKQAEIRAATQTTHNTVLPKMNQPGVEADDLAAIVKEIT